MLRAAVVGCGPRGIEHGRALRSVEGITLVGVSDQSPDVLERARQLLGVEGHSTVEKLVDIVRPHILVLATPAAARAELTVQAAQHPGLRAIVAEKPMARTIAEAEQMLGACERRDILLVVSHQLRFCQEFVAMKAAIEAGELGALEFLRGNCYGNLLNQGPHILDAMRWFAGGRRILWAMSQRSDDQIFLARHAKGDRGYWEDLDHPAPMWMTHHLAFEGGLRATLETGLLYQPSRKFIDDWLQKRVAVIGSGGFAECQVAGHFKLLSAAHGGWITLEGSLEAYLDATKAFHEELRSALNEGTPHRNDARDAIHTLEAILACAQSAADGNLVASPLSPECDPFSNVGILRRSSDYLLHTGEATLPSRAKTPAAPRLRQPEVSVIIALPDHRGHALECVESWIRRQTYARDRFEVIVVTDGSDPSLDASVKLLMGSQDQMISHASKNELLLYDAGARVAAGRILFLTESHCIAEPECLEELVKFFATHDYDGACCRSVGVCANAIARMEERQFEEGFQAFSRRGDWRKVILRGFAIYRDIYFEEGGFETEFGRFAEWAFAAKLHSRGRRLGYAPGPAVRHAYTTSFQDLFPPVRDFTRGECAYRACRPVEYCEEYFGHAEEWAQRESLRPSIAQDACRAIWSSLWRGGFGRGRLSVLAAHGKALLSYLPVAVFGPRARLLAAKGLLCAAKARCRLWQVSQGRLYRAYCDAYQRIVRYSRLEFILEHLPTLQPTLLQSCDYSRSSVRNDPSLGFHALERWQDEPFRWSGPVGILRLSLPRGSYHVRIATCPWRSGGSPLCLQIFFNRTRVPPANIKISDQEINFSIQPSMFRDGPEQRLILACNPIRPWRWGSPDRRELGVPVRSVTFERVTE